MIRITRKHCIFNAFMHQLYKFTTEQLLMHIGCYFFLVATDVFLLFNSSFIYFISFFRLHQIGEQGYRSVNHKPYQLLGEPLYLEEKKLILHSLGQNGVSFALSRLSKCCRKKELLKYWGELS